MTFKYIVKCIPMEPTATVQGGKFEREIAIDLSGFVPEKKQRKVLILYMEGQRMIVDEGPEYNAKQPFKEQYTPDFPEGCDPVAKLTILKSGHISHIQMVNIDETLE